MKTSLAVIATCLGCTGGSGDVGTRANDGPTSTDATVSCTTGKATGIGDKGCTFGRLGCTDGHRYDVSCTSGVCTCKVDDVAGATFSSTTFCESPTAEFKTTANARCGWNLSK
jgi:hypothetical protein